MKVKFSPSLMCMDLLNIEKEIKILDEKADYYHVDILDWHYCKNMSLAPCFMEAISKISKVPELPIYPVPSGGTEAGVRFLRPDPGTRLHIFQPLPPND